MTCKGRMLRKLIQSVQRSKGAQTLDAASSDARLLLNILTAYLPPIEALINLLHVCKAWRRFLLSTVHVINLTRANLSTESLLPFAAYSRIVVLDVSGNPNVTNLACLLQSLPTLTDLNVVNTGITDLTDVVRVSHSTLRSIKLNGCIPLDPLEICRNLERLEVVTSEAKDFACLQHCNNLQILRCTRCRSDKDFLQICSVFASLEELSLEGCIALMDIGCIRLQEQLKVLKLQNLDVLRDLGPITSLRGLQVLELKHIGLVNSLPEDIAELSELKRLTLSGFSGTELSQLARFTRLECLELARCESLVHIGTFLAETPLKCLRLSNCHGLLNLDAFQRVTTLSQLALRSCHALASVTGVLASAPVLRHVEILWLNSVSGTIHTLLNACTLIETLELSGSAVFEWNGNVRFPPFARALRLVDVKPDRARSRLLQLEFKSSKFSRLETLSLRGSLLDSLWVEPSLQGIRRLDLSANTLLCDLSGLQILAPSLIALDLSYCNAIADISMLRCMKRLIRLDLSSCTGVLSIDCLQDLASTLEVLSLENCSRLRSLGPLRSCSKLRLLNVSRCSCGDPSILALLPGLKLLDIRGVDLPPTVLSLLQNKSRGCFLRQSGPLFTVWTDIS